MIESLVRMINQIAANSSASDDPVGEVTQHLRNFWTPAMRSELTNYVSGHPESITEVAKSALNRL